MRKIIVPLMLILLPPQIVSVSLAWKIERPSNMVTIDDRVQSLKTNGEVSIGIGVAINKYIEGWQDYGGADFMNMNISMAANSRRGIEYAMDLEYDLRWHSPSDLSYRQDFPNKGDEWGCWVNFPAGFKFRLYGGYGSAEYTKVFVSSNGFICFDNPSALTAPTPPSTWPSGTLPNAIVAPLWTDLEIDGSASIITGLYTFATYEVFVVIWNNARHKQSDQRLTFQAILEKAPMYYPASTRYRQSQVWLSYKQVSNINTNFAFGIEDQEGLKGVGNVAEGSLLGNLNGRTLSYAQSSKSYFLKRLIISFADNNPNTRLNILEDNSMIRGMNIQRDETKQSDPDPTLGWIWVFSQVGVLLLGEAGIMVELFFITMDAAEVLAYNQYSGRKVDVTDMDDNVQHAASIQAPTSTHGVDATLSIVVHWIFDTENTNTMPHSLTISAIAVYDEYDGANYTEKSYSTPINLEICPDDNNNRASATQLQFGTTYYWQWIGGYDQIDWFSVNPNYGYNVKVTASVTSEIQPEFDLYLQDKNGYPMDSSTERGIFTKSVTGYYTLGGPGPWYIKIVPYSNWGFYKIYAETWYSGGGGGCPYVSVWNGTRYVLDNNVIPAAEGSNGTDVLDYYMLQQPLIRNHGKYALLIWDLNKHSFLDQVEFLAVDHESDVNVAVSPSGDVLTYRTSAAPVSVINMNGLDVTPILSAVDGNYYEGYAGDYLLFDFGDLDVSKGAKLILRTDILCEPKPCEESIHAQVLDANGEWVDVASFIPRVYWAFDILDLYTHLPDVNGDIKVRLYFTANHKIDYVGLDTTKQGEFQLTHGTLATANHTRLGDVKELFQNSDNLYVELLPGEQVALQFTLPQNLKEKRDFIIILEGHYFLVD